MQDTTFDPVLSILHEKVGTTENSSILTYKDNPHTEFIGLMTLDGEILTPEEIKEDTLFFENDTVMYTSEEHKHLCLLEDKQGKIGLREIHRGSRFLIYDRYKHFIVLSSWFGLLYIINYKGDELSGGKSYLNLIKVSEGHSYKFFGVNLIEQENGNKIRSIDIIDRFGNIVEENVRWTDKLKRKYLVDIAKLYGRNIKLIEYRMVKGKQTAIIDGWCQRNEFIQ